MLGMFARCCMHAASKAISRAMRDSILADGAEVRKMLAARKEDGQNMVDSWH